jgi:hypothetical protein
MCRGACTVIRCPAVPRTDWGAFTWRWQSPAAEPFPFDVTYESGGPEAEVVSHTRQFQATDRSMIHPGECPCLWLVPVADLLTNVVNGGEWQSPAIASLQRSGQSWILAIVRWHFASGSPWWLENYYQDWQWEENFAGDCSYRFGGYAGWSPYGWGGYGWAYGWGYGWGYWGSNYGIRAFYTLNGKLKDDGSDNVFTLNSFETDAEDPDNGWNNDQYWPPTVTLSRIGKTGALA